MNGGEVRIGCVWKNVALLLSEAGDYFSEGAVHYNPNCYWSLSQVLGQHKVYKTFLVFEPVTPRTPSEHFTTTQQIGGS